MKKRALRQRPRVGQKIYVDSAFSISNGSSDVVGGLATITEVEDGISGGKSVVYVSVKEHPGRSYNWTDFLSKEQKKLKKEFGKNVAYPDPDIDTPWLEEGDWYSSTDMSTGKTESGIYKGKPQW